MFLNYFLQLLKALEKRSNNRTQIRRKAQNQKGPDDRNVNDVEEERDRERERDRGRT